MKKTSLASMLETNLTRALYAALATQSLACGAVVVGERDGGRDDGRDAQADVTEQGGCILPDGTEIPVGRSVQPECGACFCPRPGAVPRCSDCSIPQCVSLDGESLRVGDTLRVGCNSCLCRENELLVCTGRACQDAGPPNDGPCAPVLTFGNGACEARVEYPCGAPGGVINSNLDRLRCSALCQPALNLEPLNFSFGLCSYRSFSGSAGGPNTVFCGVCGSGRLTDGIEGFAMDRGGQSFAQWLARSAWFEAVAARAFDRLGDELFSLEAPQNLAARARMNAIDERTHHLVLSHFAAQEGAEPLALGTTVLPHRTLEAIAVENAAEGCVRETLGAVVMRWQGLHAPSPELRSAFSAIAEEEAAHAQWSWELDAWARTVLTAEQMCRMDHARATAIEALSLAMGLEDPSTELKLRAGLPDANALASMINELRESLWSCPSTVSASAI